MNRVRKHEDNSCFDHQDDKIEPIIDFFLLNFMYFLFALSFLEKKTIFYVSWTLREKTRDDEEKLEQLNDQVYSERTKQRKKNIDKKNETFND
jgi:hypothetical protein